MLHSVSPHLVAVLALLVVGLLIAHSLTKRDRDLTSKIDLENLLLDDSGKMSKAACVMLGAFVLTTWIMVQLTLNGQMTEGYLAIYVGAWITPATAAIIKKSNDPPA